MQSVVALAGAALLTALTVLVVRVIFTTLPKLHTAVDEAAGLLKQGNALGKKANEGVDAVKEGIAEVVGSAKKAVPAATGLAVAATGYIAGKSIVSTAPTTASTVGVGPLVTLQVAQIALQVATLVYIKARFDGLEAKIALIHADIDSKLNHLQRMMVLNQLADLTRARAYFELLSCTDETVDVIPLDRAEILEVIRLLAAGIAHARQLATVTPSHEVLAYPFLVEHAGAHLQEVNGILGLLLGDVDDATVRKRCEHCQEQLSSTWRVWDAHIRPSVRDGKMTWSVPPEEMQARVAELKNALGPLPSATGWLLEAT